MKIKKTLKIGRSDFKRIVDNNHYFVDKTMLISDFLKNANDILLMPRPKRFGKTLNLSMIEYFFDINKKDSTKLFDEFEISKEKEFCEQHQNKYPVINFSLKSIKASNWNDSYNHFENVISELYEQHLYLSNSDKLNDLFKEKIRKIFSKQADEIELQYSLKNLSKYLKIHFKQDVIILVDEYDTPIIYAYANTEKPFNSEDKTTYYGQVIEFMQTFLGEAFKGNKTLQKGLLTGIMRIAKESIFSDWNNFKVFSLTSPYFADKFGFTETETRTILKYYNLFDKVDKVKQWYDGYKFGKTDKIYNPWSIVNYVAFHEEGFKAHWVNTGRDMLIKERITEPKIKENLQNLITGKSIEKKLHENFVFSDLDNEVIENDDDALIWTLLTYSGYLTQIKELKYDNYELKIPNNEIKTVFKEIIVNWLKEKVRIRRETLISTSDFLINNKLPEFEKGFKQIVGDTISYFDTAPIIDKKTQKVITSKEQIFHVYTLGLLAILSDDFNIKSNREAGEGRYDIMLIPYDKSKNGVVIEIKQIDKRKNETEKTYVKKINTKIKEGLNQINENKYYIELLESGIKPENIIKLAIVFAGKEPFVKPIPID
jgi:hypothetical protein